MVWLSYVVKGPEDLNEEIKGDTQCEEMPASEEGNGRVRAMGKGRCFSWLPFER